MDTKKVLEHITDVNLHIALPDEAAKEVEKTVLAIASDSDFENKVDEIYIDVFDKQNGHRDKVDALAELKNIDKNVLALTLAEIFSMGTKLIYENHGWDKDIFYDNLLDITIWAKVCKKATGKWGLIEFSWICSSLTANVIRLGRLQFQLLNTQESVLPVTVGGITIKMFDRVINIHIPEGDSITKEKRFDSYRKAYKFFNQTGHAVFMCHSWLLYPKHKEILPENSNINSFIDDFNIVSFKEDSNGDYWRVFGPGKNYNDPDSLPQDTGIQKAYVNELKAGRKPGGALGFFVFDGKDIIS